MNRDELAQAYARAKGAHESTRALSDSMWRHSDTADLNDPDWSRLTAEERAERNHALDLVKRAFEALADIAVSGVER